MKSMLVLKTSLHFGVFPRVYDKSVINLMIDPWYRAKKASYGSLSFHKSNVHTTWIHSWESMLEKRPPPPLLRFSGEVEAWLIAGHFIPYKLGKQDSLMSP